MGLVETLTESASDILKLTVASHGKVPRSRALGVGSMPAIQ